MPKLPDKKKVAAAKEATLPKDLSAKALAFEALKAEATRVKKEQDKIKAELKEAVEKYGTKDPNSGHILLPLEHAGQKVELKLERRVSAVQNPEIDTKIKELLPQELVDKIIEKVEVVRDDVVDVLYDNGEITDEVLAELYDEKETYAFKTKKV